MATDTISRVKKEEFVIKRPLVGFIIVILLALVFLYGMPALPSLGIGENYSEMVAKTPNELGAAIRWALGDWNDAQFYKSWIGGLLLIIGGFVAYLLEKSNSKYKGFGVSYGSGLWPSVLAATVLADFISNLLYTHLLINDPIAKQIAWVPTFIPVCSLAAGAILTFGSGWKKILTAGILGGLVGCPGSYFIIKYICVPTGMPVAVGNVGVMVVASILFHETYQYVPWMRKQAIMPVVAEVTQPAPEVKSEPKLAYEEDNQDFLFVRRVFADLCEANFYGSEWAGLLMVIGLVIQVVLNNQNPAYGSGMLGPILASQFLASGIGLYVYWHRFKQLGWIATFVPVVTLGPAAVLLYGSHLYVVLTAAIFGGLFGAPIAGYISSHIPKHWHSYTGAVSSMLIITLLFIAMMQALPWFGQPPLW